MKTTKADEKALLEAESRYCSYGDTVHYLEPAKLFAGCNGSFLYDYEDKPYLDLQMWYSAVNFGYANPRLNDALKRQIDTLPQVASQYLHKEKIELAAMLCESIKDAWGEEGRVHFNVGGSQAIEDSLKLVRNAPVLGFSVSLPAIGITAAVFGGIGSIPGAMLGGILLGIIEIFAKAFNTNISDAVVFAVLIVVLLVKPSGLLGKTVREKV